MIENEPMVLVPRRLLNKIKPILGSACAASNTFEGVGAVRVKVYDELCAVLNAPHEVDESKKDAA